MRLDHGISVPVPYPPLTPIFSSVMFSICFDVASVCLICIQSLVVLSFLVPYWLDWLALVCLFGCLSSNSRSHRNLRAKKHHHNHNSFGIFVKSIAPQRKQHGLLQGSGKTNAHERPETIRLPWDISFTSFFEETSTTYVCFAILFEFISSHIPPVLRHNSPLVFLSSMISIILCQ